MQFQLFHKTALAYKSLTIRTNNIYQPLSIIIQNLSSILAACLPMNTPRMNACSSVLQSLSLRHQPSTIRPLSTPASAWYAVLRQMSDSNNLQHGATKSVSAFSNLFHQNADFWRIIEKQTTTRQSFQNIANMICKVLVVLGFKQVIITLSYFAKP